MPLRNLADPDDEPTGEDFRELTKRAFAGVRAARERRLREMRERIRQGRGASAPDPAHQGPAE